MNKTAIKNFAVTAREKLIQDARYQAGLLGVTADGITDGRTAVTDSGNAGSTHELFWIFPRPPIDSHANV